MASLNLKTKQLRYTKADLTALDNAATLLASVAEYDAAAKQDANTARNAINHVIEHIEKRNGKAEEKAT
jgi:hypothetical protein